MMLLSLIVLTLVKCTLGGHLQKGDGCALYLPVGDVSVVSQRQYFQRSVIGLPGGGQPCITYGDVETAFAIATSSKARKLPPPGQEWVPEDVKEIGEILLDISKIIAQQYKLSPGVIFHLLPQIDTTKTSILGICPPHATPLKCIPGRYRRIDGLCNNLKYPTWGATRTVFERLVPPAYADGIHAPRVSVVGGEPLPSGRTVSFTIHRDEGFHDHAASLLIVAWGQLMDHDFTLTATPLNPVNRNEVDDCCTAPPALKDPYCFEIFAPPHDNFFNLFGPRAKCIDFVRAFPGTPQNCQLGVNSPFNILTATIDGNTVYGGSDEAARGLREMRGGLLRESRPYAPGLQPMLPLKTDLPDEGCTRESPDQNCFDAGEIRVNEQLILTCAHTIMFREHNRIARILGKLNPHWSDEHLYQETRHIVAAEIQHITFNEFLPQLLGYGTMKEFDLLLEEKGYWDGYNPTVNPSMTDAFVTAAFRFGHSLLPSTVERWSPTNKYIASKRLSQLIRQPFDLFKAAHVDEYLMGMLNQPAQAMDDAITQEVTNHLFQSPTARFGVDLVAFNMQRGREFGTPGYNAHRKFCGFPPVYNFHDLANYMSNTTAARYASIYKHVDDIDLWSAGVSERPKPGSLLGPTFSCIIAHQMARVRKGDRFWYELPNQPSSFTPEQLYALKKVRLARVVCDNTDYIETIQVYPLVLQDHEINPRVPCKSGIIPHLDLKPWIDRSNYAAPPTVVSQVETVVEEIVPHTSFNFF